MPTSYRTPDMVYGKNVLVLTNSTFDSAIAEHEQILIEFCCSDCGDCKSLSRDYEKAAKVFRDSPIKFAVVDLFKYWDLYRRFNDRGSPTIKYFKNGNVCAYNGGLTEDEIVSWLQRKITPAVIVVSEQELLLLQQSQAVVVLGVFSSPDSPAIKAFLTTAADDELHFYAISYDSNVQQKLGIFVDSIVILKYQDDFRVDYTFTTDTTVADILQFILDHSSPLIEDFSRESSQKIFNSPILKHFLIFTNKDSEHHLPTLTTFRDVAATYKGQLLFVNIPTTERRTLDYFEIKSTDVPEAMIVDLGESGLKKYPYEGEFNPDYLKSFIQQYFDGNLQYYLKSEKVSLEDTSNDVVIVRGKSFQEIVINNDKDVFIQFYAPWSETSKKIAPIWDELGQFFKSDDNLVIAKIDGTSNEVEVSGVSVRGFPTIYFFKGNNKANPVRYEGLRRELKDFLPFLEDHGHHVISPSEL